MRWDDSTHMFASVHSEDHEGAENGGQDTHGSFRPKLHPSSVAPPLLPQLLLFSNSFLRFSSSSTPSSVASQLLPQLLLLPNSFLSSSPTPSSAAAPPQLLHQLFSHFYPTINPMPLRQNWSNCRWGPRWFHGWLPTTAMFGGTMQPYKPASYTTWADHHRISHFLPLRKTIHWEKQERDRVACSTPYPTIPP